MREGREDHSEFEREPIDIGYRTCNNEMEGSESTRNRNERRKTSG